jgi:uncharacterized LabA/DUF88 family protein
MALAGIPIPSDPHLRRWMLFVDGENFTLRAQKVAENNAVALTDGPYYSKDLFLWLPALPATANMTPGYLRLQDHATRSFYYTAVTGDEDRVQQLKRKIRERGFNPQVFKKQREKSKGVDITLSKDLLLNAFFDNYDVAVLIAGDGDYVPLVEEVKRLGKVVYLVFFEKEGLSPDLHMAVDSYFDFTQFFIDSWRRVACASETT